MFKFNLPQLTKRTPLQLDKGIPAVSDFVRAKIHKGGAYHIQSTNQYKGALASAATFDVLLSIPAGVIVHLAMGLTADTDIDFYMRETATTSADGTSFAHNSFNRRDWWNPSCAWYHTPTVTGSGTIIFFNRVNANGPLHNILSLHPSAWWVLDQNTKYLFRMTNAGASAGDLNIVANYWEEAI
jgi:hypothetical protein